MKLPKLGPLGASFSDDIVLAPAAGDPNPGTLRAPTSFGDDIPTGSRLAVRLRLTSEGGRLLFDFADSDAVRDGPPAMRLAEAQVERATLAAINTVLGRPADDVEAQAMFEALAEPDTWVGAGASDDAMIAAFGMARVYDAALGAMANAWPSKVGAGSCTLGAYVTMQSGDSELSEVLEGGEGATPTRDGASRWAGPLTDPRRASVPWCEATEEIRQRSGGVGARNGGNGIRRSYTVSREATVSVGIDRITNPPHGIDRAGPPQPAGLWITRPGDEARRVAPWISHELRAGSTLTIETCGGAGHGFPGWGVDWDPDSF